MPFINPEHPRVQAALTALRLADFSLAVLWRWVTGLAFALAVATGLALASDWSSTLWPGQRILIWLHSVAAWLLLLHLLGHVALWLRRVARHPHSLLAGLGSQARLLWGLLGLVTAALALTGFARFTAFRYGWDLPFGLTALHARAAHSVLTPWLFVALLLLLLRYTVPIVRFLRQDRAR